MNALKGQGPPDPVDAVVTEPGRPRKLSPAIIGALLPRIIQSEDIACFCGSAEQVQQFACRFRCRRGDFQLGVRQLQPIPVHNVGQRFLINPH